ncbi:MAG: hypothetical protein LRY40_04645 [Shewanella fodinae]|nr:hypothetical protein [Shewanella fodinae]
MRPDLSEMFDHDPSQHIDTAGMFQLPGKSPLRILGSVPYNLALVSPRASDLAKHLSARILNAGEMHTRRLRKVTFCARSLPNMVTHIKTDSLLVTSGDRSDVIVSACLAAMNGVKIGALLLSGGYEPEPAIMELCEQAFETGLPVFLIDSNTWQTSLNIQRFDHEVPVDDAVRIDLVQEYVASHIDQNWIESVTENSPREHRLSPPAFRYKTDRTWQEPPIKPWCCQKVMNHARLKPPLFAPSAVSPTAYCWVNAMKSCVLPTCKA